MNRKNLFSGITPVTPCMDEKGNIYLTGQMDHVASEYKELQRALCLYQAMPTGKQRADLAEEAIDLMTCVATLVMAACPDLIGDAIQLVNCKNRMRGYCMAQQCADFVSPQCGDLSDDEKAKVDKIVNKMMGHGEE